MNLKLKKTVYTGVFAAMIFVLTFFVKVTVASGYVHFGDALIYLCACFLGGPWAMLAGAVGAGLADLIGGFALYAPATVIIKALIAVPFILAKDDSRFLTLKTGFMTIPSGMITVGGYFIADLIIDKTYAVIDIPGNVIQAVGSALIFVVFAGALDAVKVKKKIKLI